MPTVHRVAREDALIWAALSYEGAARHVIAAYKDGGRTDAGAALAVPLRAAIVAALAAVPPESRPPVAESGSAAARGARRHSTTGIQLVTIPSSQRAWRSRGYHPVDALLHRAGLRPFPALAQRGESLDQVGLGRTARAANKEHSLVARRPLDDTRVILVDDIVTTGATLLEARRAVFAAGGTVVGMVALAETRRRLPPPARSGQTHRQIR